MMRTLLLRGTFVIVFLLSISLFPATSFGEILTIKHTVKQTFGGGQSPDDARISGIAFSNSMVGLVHNLGHAIGSVCGVPHGMCMAILLPYGLEYNMHKCEESMARLLLPMAGEAVYLDTPKEQRAQKVVSLIRQLNEDLNKITGGRHARFLQEVKDREGKPMVPREVLPQIARAALLDGASIYNPEDIDYEDNLMVLEAAWEGKPLDRNKLKKG